MARSLPKGTRVVVDENAFNDPTKFPVTFKRGGREFVPEDPFLADEIKGALSYNSKGRLVVDADRLETTWNMSGVSIDGACLWASCLGQGG
jgi:hypothetical protein